MLSAAHCGGGIFDQVQIGRYNRKDVTDTYEAFDIIEEIIHPLYQDDTIDHDQMIVILSGDSTATPIPINRDPAVPSDGALVTVMGWGLTEEEDENSASPVLKRADLNVISNDECENSKSGLLYDSYQGLIEDDMLCAGTLGSDSCQGDSGGPLIQTDSNGNDLLVGVVSWGYGCANPDFPGVYSRVSYFTDWIESNVCARATTPPSDFDCSNNGSSAPTPSTTAQPPTPTPATGDLINVTVGIQLDDYPEEIGWRIDQLGLTVNEIIRVPAGVYRTPDSVVTRTVAVPKGELYSFAIFDVIGDGMCCQFGEGRYQVSLDTTDVNDADKIIIASRGDFNYGKEYTFLASLDEDQPTGGSTNASTDGPFLTIQIQFDGYPSEIGWILRSDVGVPSQTRIEGRQTTNTVAFRPPRYYNASLANQIVTETIAIPPSNADYTFIMTDSFGDGLCCENGTGYYKLWQGPAEDNVLLANGDLQGMSREVSDFTLSFSPNSSPSATNTPASSPAPTVPLPTVDVRIDLQFDSYPEEMGWSIQDSNLNEIVKKPPGTYTTPNSQVSETVALASGQSYLFTMVDNFGDGMCCGNGNGTYYVYIEEGNNSVLAVFGSEFKTEDTSRFVIGNEYPINLQFGTDLNPGEIAWYMERLDLEEGTATVAISPYEYGGQASTIVTESVMGEESGVYRFVILDAGGDGTCCEHGDGFYRMFVGDADTSDDSNAVVFSRGDLYKDSAEHIFIAKWPQPTDTLPADSPILTLEIQFDDYPQDVVWILKADDVHNSTATSRMAPNQSVIAFGPQEPFPSSLIGQTTSVEIKIPQISSGTTRAFRFMFIDIQDDGLCCDYGQGSYTLYFGPKTNDQVLASGTAEKSGRVIHDFVLSDSGVISTSSISGPTSGSHSVATWSPGLFAAMVCVLFCFPWLAWD